MILIADSGSTKCDWMLLKENNFTQLFSTMGFNPFFHNESVISNGIKENVELAQNANNVTHIYLYSSGCSSAELKMVVEKGLKQVFTKANIFVDHDLVGAAYATYSGVPGITCILGTGSNSCYFDGKNLSEEVPSLGYILGDEGSGSYFGKKLLIDYLYKKLPIEMNEYLMQDLKLTKKEIFENVYMKPHANVYLASFMKIFGIFKNSEYVKLTVSAGLRHFLENHVCCFGDHKKVPVHFIGSIAYHFEDLLKLEAKKLDIEVGNIIQKPIDGLVDYHLKYVIGKS
ncbi:MAG TPA: ATPase [Bacteroidia bacterium]|nr:ATPase [Bacteroidia bacterium]